MRKGKQKPKFKYVKQRGNSDCGVACLAMVTSHAYDFIDKHFGKVKNNGMLVTDLMKYLSEYGFITIRKLGNECIDLGRMNKILSEPFADAHILLLEYKLDNAGSPCHFVVMDKKGKVFDPEDDKCKSLDKFYKVVQNIGVFYK